MKRIVYSFLSIIMLSFLLSSCTAQSNRLTADEFEQHLQHDNILLVDVRTPQEFAQGHLRGAVNIDIYNDNFLSRMQSLDTTQTLLLYCHSGNRSKQALQMLEKSGFKAVYDLDGGILEWIK